MRVSPAQNIQDSTHTLTDGTALTQEETASSNPVSANLRGVYQELSLPTVPNQHNLSVDFALDNSEQALALTPGTDEFNDAWTYRDKQGALTILLRQVRQILYGEDKANAADKILEAYKYSMLICKEENVTTKISSTELLEKVDQVLITQKSPDTSPSENSNNQRYFSWKQNINSGVENLALFLEVTETQPKEHEFAKRSFLQRTFLEWAQLVYFSLFPTAGNNKNPLRDKESKRKLPKRSAQDSEAEQDERS